MACKRSSVRPRLAPPLICIFFFCSHRLTVRTSPFHGEYRGSNPLGNARDHSLEATATWRRLRACRAFGLRHTCPTKCRSIECASKQRSAVSARLPAQPEAEADASAHTISPRSRPHASKPVPCCINWPARVRFSCGLIVLWHAIITACATVIRPCALLSCNHSRESSKRLATASTFRVRA